jgi:hypothetical protein
VRRLGLHLLASLLLACASVQHQPPIAPIPPLADIGRRPPPPPKAAPRKLAQFPDTPVSRGECKNRPAGILVSHGVYAELHEAVAERQRLAVETSTLLRLRNEEHAIALQIEQEYRLRIDQLERSLATEKRGTSWKYLAAAVTGGLVVLATVYASRPLAR